MHKTGIAADPVVTDHDTGPGHPEQSARFAAVIDRLSNAGLLDATNQLMVRRATKDDLALVHTPVYIRLVEREIAQGRRELSTGDADLSPHSLEPARAAAGCVLSAVDAVCTGQVSNAFCIVRPPGHHASAARGMGFCLFNNIAVGARHAQRQHGAGRIAIVDWDVHHGNGTQDIFYQDGSVLFFSTHQSPWYPGTGDASEQGEGAGAGSTINAPLPAGTGRLAMFEALQTRLLPALKTFRPDLIMVSAGFDSRINDPLGQFTLTDLDFRDLTLLLLEAADHYCRGKLVSVLEGGYNLDGLASAAEAHVRALVSQ